MAAPHSESFRDQIRRRLDKAAAGIQRRRTDMDQHMAALETREERFRQIAKQLLADALLPAMQEFADHFENAHLDDAGPVRGVRCELWHCVRFPASARLECRVTHDETVEAILVHYHAEVLPVFIRFERDDELRLAIDSVDVPAVRAWLEQKLLNFLDSYVQIETHSQYQRDNVAVDPVCGMSVIKPQGLAHEHKGHEYYFCAQRCLAKFKADPAHYAQPAGN